MKRFVVATVVVLCLVLILLYTDCSWYKYGCSYVPYGITVANGEAAITEADIDDNKTTSKFLYPKPSMSLDTDENAKTPSTTPPSMSLDIDERAKWQREQVENYCKKHPFTEVGAIIPPTDRHFIYDDKRKIVFCFTPKAGCTPIKRVLFLLQKKIPEHVTDQRKINSYMVKAISSSSFGSPSMTHNATARQERLRNYFKFTVLRNPLERLLSAFLDKIEPQLKFRAVRSNSLRKPEHCALDILKLYRPKEYERWYASNGNTKLTVTFSDYIRWYISSDKHKLNDHFAPFTYLAKICLVKYDFYITFKLYNSDMLELTKRFGGTPDMLWTVGHNQKSSNSRMDNYYGSLSADLKRRLHLAMQEDLEFYHLLQPEDRTYNQRLLSV